MSISSVTRFSIGAIIGLLIAGIYWHDTSLFLADSVSLMRGIIGCLTLALSCGLITWKWGYSVIEFFFNNLYI